MVTLGAVAKARVEMRGIEFEPYCFVSYNPIRNHQCRNSPSGTERSSSVSETIAVSVFRRTVYIILYYISILYITHFVLLLKYSK